MTTIRRLLERIIAATESGNRQRVTQLNAQFDQLVPLTIEGYNDYDNLRQSCILAFTCPHLYDQCMADARERFERIYNL